MDSHHEHRRGEHLEAGVIRSCAFSERESALCRRHRHRRAMRDACTLPRRSSRVDPEDLNLAPALAMPRVRNSHRPHLRRCELRHLEADDPLPNTSPGVRGSGKFRARAESSTLREAYLAALQSDSTLASNRSVSVARLCEELWQSLYCAPPPVQRTPLPARRLTIALRPPRAVSSGRRGSWPAAGLDGSGPQITPAAASAAMRSGGKCIKPA